ncbi:MAG TPA: hypothetical protein VMO88_13715 [Acidimicrobiales bacterium]|nr:hypothetical protein [Acidimicrobiales bacterium]
MDRPVTPLRRLSPLFALAAAAALAASSCSSSHHGAAVSGANQGTVGGGAGSNTASTIAAPTSSTAPGAAGAGAASTPIARSSGPSSSASRGGGSAPATGNGSAASNSGTGAPAPAVPGTYAIDQSGGITTTPSLYSANEPPQGTLVVDPAQPNGTQVEHRYVQQGDQPANTTAQYLPSGPVILSTTEGSGAQGVSCTFNPPIAAPPWPPAVGKTFSSQGNCGNGTSVTVQGKIAGSQTTTLKDGETFTVWVIDSTINMTGQITASGTQVDWYAPSIRLPTHEQVDVKGTYSGVQFTLHSVSDLVSSHPS